jgi:hypothetical protein
MFHRSGGDETKLGRDEATFRSCEDISKLKQIAMTTTPTRTIFVGLRS